MQVSLSSLPPVRGHIEHTLPQQDKCRNMYAMLWPGELIKGSVPKVFIVNWSYRHLRLSTHQNSRPPEGKSLFYMNHILYTSKHRKPALLVWKPWDQTLLKSKFPCANKDQLCKEDLVSKDSYDMLAMLTLTPQLFVFLFCFERVLYNSGY